MGTGTGKGGVEERKVEDRTGKNQKKKTQARNVRKVAQHGVGASKSRLDKPAGEELCGQMRHEKLHTF